MDTKSNVILRWPQVKAKTGICRSYAHLLISQNKFPAPIKLGSRASGWLEHEIEQWLSERIAASRQGGDVVIGGAK